MADDGIKIVRSAGFDSWVRGLERVGNEIPREAEEEWEQAVEMLFGGTQQYAHVVSGDMVTGGEMAMHREGDQLVGEISYGGNRRSDAKPWWKHQYVDYVEYELRRGGSHDFFQVALDRLTPAVEQGLSRALVACFQAAL